MYFESATKDDIGINELDDKKSHAKQAELLVADVISNYKTVASFGHDHIIINEFEGLLEHKMALDVKNGKIFGLSWGISQAVTNGVFGALYLASGELYYAYPDYEYMQVDRLYIAMFCLLFGAFTAG